MTPHQTSSQPTVERDDESDRSIRSPFLDFTNIGSQRRVIDGAVEDLAASRHCAVRRFDGRQDLDVKERGLQEPAL